MSLLSLLPNFLVYQTVSSASSADCLSHLPLYFPLLRAGFDKFPLFSATSTPPLMSQADFLKFLCVTQGLPTHTRHKHSSPSSWETQRSWTCNSASFLPGSPPLHTFPAGAQRAVPGEGGREGQQEGQAGGKTALSLWQLHLLVLAQTPCFKLFQTQMDKCKQPKGTFTCYELKLRKMIFCFLVLLQFLSVPLPVHDSCPPQIVAVQWKKEVSGFFQTGQYKQNKAPPFINTDSGK